MKAFRHLCAAMALMLAARAAEFDHDHAGFAAVLRAHVRDGLVDYAALKAGPAPLDAYLDALAKPTEAEFDGWSEPRRMAFLINLYNATTLRLVRDRYPVKSIRKIGPVLAGPWKMRVVRAWGATHTLDDIEHARLRPKFREPRIHFALVCAAVSCPPLREEPFVEARLNDQLDDQARRFLGDTTKNRWDAATATLHLSPIFQWYEGDFTAGGGTVAAFVAPYLPATAVLPGKDVRVKHLDYDWALNDLRK